MTNDEKNIKTRMTNDEFSALSYLVIFSGFGFLVSGFKNSDIKFKLVNSIKI